VEPVGQPHRLGVIYLSYQTYYITQSLHIQDQAKHGRQIQRSTNNLLMTHFMQIGRGTLDIPHSLITVQPLSVVFTLSRSLLILLCC